MTTRAIFVVNSIGDWKDSNGSSRKISNPADLKHLVSSRQWCDLIISSGSTVRANSYSPTQKPLWIITRRPSDFDHLVAAGAEVVAGSAAEIVSVAMSKAENLLCEFGPQSLNEIIEAGLLDEFDLSVTGKFEPHLLSDLLRGLPLALTDQHPRLIFEDEELAVYRFLLRP